MDKHNYLITLLYGFIACVILSLCGQFAFGITVLIGCVLYGLFQYARGRREEKNLMKQLRDVPEYVKEITLCYIRKRNPRLNKREEKQVLKDVSESKYEINSRRLIQKVAEETGDMDGGYNYYLTFENGSTYDVPERVYGFVAVGDNLWVVKTSALTMMVLQSGSHYYNMFGRAVAKETQAQNAYTPN